MQKRTSKTVSAGEAHTAPAECSSYFSSLDFSSLSYNLHPKAWVHKLCIDEGYMVLKGV